MKDYEVGVRVYNLDQCKGFIKKLVYEDSKKIEIIEQIYSDKVVSIPQSTHDIIIRLFRHFDKQISNITPIKKYILLSNTLRLAKNSAIFINNLEKNTKIKVYDQTPIDSMEMIVLSIKNNLKFDPNKKIIDTNNFILMNFAQNKIYFGGISPEFEGLDFYTEDFSSLALENFIKKSVLIYSPFKRKSVNPIGKENAQKTVNYYKMYLEQKFPVNFNKKLSAEENSNKKQTKFTQYINKQIKKVKKPKDQTLILTGDMLLSNLKIINIRDGWIRKDHLLKGIEKYSEYQDKKLISNDARFAVINLIILHGLLNQMGFEKAYLLQSNSEEGFILHSKFN